MSRILVGGKSEQLAPLLSRIRTAAGLSRVAVGRPQLDLENPGTVESVVRAVEPSAIINAAAYTAVDQAESEPERAFTVNRDGAEQLASEAQRRAVPFIHISTDYVFDGRKPSRYTEEIPRIRPTCMGARSSRHAYAAALVLRTSWLYSGHGHNFLTTMLRVAHKQDAVRVVDNQHGAPTAADEIAEAILAMLRIFLVDGFESTAGIYHLTAQGETTWHGFSTAIFAGCARRGCKVPKLVAISSAEYPTAAVRPINSRLDCSKIERQFGLRLPPWQQSIDSCLDRLSIQAEPEAC